MKTSSQLNELLQAINKNQSKEMISALERKVAEDIENSVGYDSFFNLPFENIFSIVSKISIYSASNYPNILANIIQRTAKAHQTEKETLFLLYHIQGDQNLTVEDILFILSSFKEIELFRLLNDKYKEMEKSLEVDREYEITSQKNKEIGELKKQIEQLEASHSTAVVTKKQFEQRFPPIQKKPLFFESDLCKAVAKGKLDSVQYHIEKIETYIDQKATANNEKYNISVGDTPLHVGCKSLQFKIVQYLIEKGANIEAKDYFQRTPLHVACYIGNLPVVQYLVEKGANIEAREQDQRTPLHCACENNLLPIMQYLIEKGANIEARTKEQKTVFLIAARKGYLPIFQYLVEKGADLNAVDDHNMSAHQLALECGRTNIVQYIRTSFKAPDPINENNNSSYDKY